MEKKIQFVAPGVIEPEKVIKYIRNDFKKYILNSDLKSVVIGQSGGIDSALVTAILVPVCKDMGIEMVGVSMPSDSNKKDEIIRADKIMGSFCDQIAVIPIESYIEKLCNDIKTGDEHSIKIRKGNMKARMRMIILYDLAQFKQGMVLSTDNYTELLLGFWTLHGDVGDYGCLQNIWKTDVYRLAQWIIDKELIKPKKIGYTMGDTEKKEALSQCMEAVPTDGLGITNSDFDQIGVNSYEEADKILYEYITGGEVDMKHPVVARHLRTEFKRQNPYNVI